MNVPDVDPPLEGWLDVQLAGIAESATEAALLRGELAVTVVDDAAMADLHKRYKGAAGTTDVLTFDLREHSRDPLEGDIVICLDEAARQAATRGHDVRVEALLYAVHGLLHLLGEDDEREEDAARMHRREDELLTAAGFGAVFAASGDGDEG